MNMDPEHRENGIPRPAARPRPYRILKFGGTSVSGVERIDVMAEVARDRSRTATPVVVVSAFAGVTNSLAGVVRAAVTGEWRSALRELLTLHEQYAADLLAGGSATVREGLGEAFDELSRLLQGMHLIGEASPRSLDLVLSAGERLSALIVAQALCVRGLAAEACDARRLIVTDACFGDAAVDFAATREAVRRHFAAAADLQVVTGFVGASARGETTTLGRGGSDYTAAILGTALDVEAVEIWTDVPGVMSADPQQVAAAFPLHALSYEELAELSHWGARVVHCPAVRPLRERRIPLYVRNTLAPEDPGTEVRTGAGSEADRPVRGIASVDRVALIQVQAGARELGPRLTARVFEALGRGRARVLLVGQSSSESSLCVAVHSDSVAAAMDALEEELAAELRAGLMPPPALEPGCSLIAVVGEGMRRRPGISGRVFGVLGNHGVNVRAIAQGSSELNISFIVAAVDERIAIRAVHDAFFAPGPPPAEVFLVGPGRVGGALLEQVAAAAPASRARIVIGGVARSRAVAVEADGVRAESWAEQLRPAERALDELVDAALASGRHPRVFVDCTAGAEAPAHYERLLRAGVSVVTANKVGLAGAAAVYGRLRTAAEDGGRLYYESTVGAGLPLLRTVQELVRTGDRVRGIDGVLSGSLGYILDRLAQGRRLSQAVEEALRLGYTEPDPREDLSGGDVARKLLILARDAGLDLEPEDIDVQPLVPCWEGLTVDEFLCRLPELDTEYDGRRQEASERGERLVFLARLADGRASVRVRPVGPEHPCWSLRGAENLVAITSDRYADVPLVIRGPGAGPAVTAAAVFADVLRAGAEAGDAPVLVGRETRDSPVRRGRRIRRAPVASP